MITGKVYFVHSGNDNDNLFASDQQYYDLMGVAIDAAFRNINATTDSYLDAYLVTKDSPTARQFNIAINPAVIVAIDQYAPKVFFLTGIRTQSYLTNWFTNLFKGNTNGTGVTNDGDSPNGSDFKIFNFDRDCNPLDKFLDFIKIGQIKRGVYGVGALYMAYKAVTIPTGAGQAISAGMAGALGYLALGDPQSACDGTLSFDKDAKALIIGGTVAVLIGGVWYFYLKDEIANRRLARLLGAASGRTSTASKKTGASPRRRANRPKSVTKTIRY